MDSSQDLTAPLVGRLISSDRERARAMRARRLRAAVRAVERERALAPRLPAEIRLQVALILGDTRLLPVPFTFLRAAAWIGAEALALAAEVQQNGWSDA